MKSIISTKRLKEIEANKFERLQRRAQAPWLHTRKVHEKVKEGMARRTLMKMRTLDERKLKAIDLLADFQNNWPFEYIAEQIGVTLLTLRKWRNQPVFITRLDAEITKRRNGFRLEAYRHLFKKVKSGNMRSIREYLKLTGDLKENVEIQIGEISKMSDEKLANELKELEAELGISIE